MAAAGSAVFRPSRGLMVLSLLCLLGLGDSLIEMEKVEKLMEQILTMGQKAKYMKADHDEMKHFSSEILAEMQRFLPELLHFLKKMQTICKTGPPLFHPLAEIMDIAYTIIERAITNKDWTDDDTKDLNQFRILANALQMIYAGL